MAMARSTPAQKPRGCASRISMRLFSHAGAAGPPGIGAVEQRLQPGMHAAQPADDLLRPVEMLPLPLPVPGHRRTRCHVPDVAYLVGHFDERCLAAELSRGLNPQRLAPGFG